MTPLLENNGICSKFRNFPALFHINNQYISLSFQSGHLADLKHGSENSDAQIEQPL